MIIVDDSISATLNLDEVVVYAPVGSSEDSDLSKIITPQVGILIGLAILIYGWLTRRKKKSNWSKNNW